MPSTPFSPQTLLAKIRTLPESGHYWIAYSGGMDSHVLLHAFLQIKNEIPSKISAVHIDHGINRDSASWAEHCRRVCAELGIEYYLYTLDEQCPRGESIESWARSKRYGFFKECINAGEMLFTAQHLDDQVETLLLQLFRGSGPKGLSAMPETRRFGLGWLVRPLLGFSRDALHKYAMDNSLSWIEDDMNANQNYDRSFLRHSILPQLRTRWPNLSRVLARAGKHQAEAAELLDDLAALDIKTYLLPDPDTLSLKGIENLATPRRRNMLRYWFRSRNLQVPDSRTLQQILSEVVASREDAQPCILWHGMEIRKYRQVLYLVTRSDQSGESVNPIWDLDTQYSTCLGRLLAERGRGDGIRLAAVPGGQLAIHYRRGGESMRPAGRGHHHSLKKLFQERHVLPWLRDKVPLLYLNDALVAVAGFWIEDGYQAGPDEDAWQIRWEGVDKVTLK